MKIILDNNELDLKDCIHFKDKLLGFMFKRNFNYALRFRCKSIHTFFMKKNIDVIITDKNNKILYIYNNLSKNKIIIKKDAYYFYELPNNTNTYKVKDIIKIIK